MKYSIIIPCYNEEDNIENLVARIRVLQDKYDLEYVLVENGSKDGSSEYFKEHVEGKYKNIQVVFVPENRGYGYGLQQGMKAAKGDYVGWIHADLQITPEDLIRFFNSVEEYKETARLFLKGRRYNRPLFDRFFTAGQSAFNTFLFATKLHDVGAIPVLFSNSLLKEVEIDNMPNDFSIELFVYKEAKRLGYTVKRIGVRLLTREKGKSSWNTGLRSKIRQSKRIFQDSIKIKKGEKVL